jgi:hypothetical protein
LQSGRLPPSCSNARASRRRHYHPAQNPWRRTCGVVSVARACGRHRSSQQRQLRLIVTNPSTGQTKLTSRSTAQCRVLGRRDWYAAAGSLRRRVELFERAGCLWDALKIAGQEPQTPGSGSRLRRIFRLRQLDWHLDPVCKSRRKHQFSVHRLDELLEGPNVQFAAPLHL